MEHRSTNAPANRAAVITRAALSQAVTDWRHRVFHPDGRGGRSRGARRYAAQHNEIIRETPPEWIERWVPQVVLLSVAVGDPEGWSDPQVLEALPGNKLLRTDENGWVELSTDGQRLRVEVEKTYLH